MAERLTEAVVRNLVSPTKGQRFLFDTIVPGFAVRVLPTGSRAFVLNYRVRGSERRMTIGSSPVWTVTRARKRAAELRRSIDMGDDPMQERRIKRAAELPCKVDVGGDPMKARRETVIVGKTPIIASTIETERPANDNSYSKVVKKAPPQQNQRMEQPVGAPSLYAEITRLDASPHTALEIEVSNKLRRIPGFPETAWADVAIIIQNYDQLIDQVRHRKLDPDTTKTTTLVDTLQKMLSLLPDQIKAERTKQGIWSECTSNLKVADFVHSANLFQNYHMDSISREIGYLELQEVALALLNKIELVGPVYRGAEWHEPAMVIAAMVEARCQLHRIKCPTRNSVKSPLVIAVTDLLRLAGERDGDGNPRSENAVRDALVGKKRRKFSPKSF